MTTTAHGRQAHPARLFRRPRHLVLRAVAGGDLRPPGRHRHRRHRRHRRRGRARRWTSARRRSAPSRITSSTPGAAYFEQVLRFLIMGNVRRGNLYPLCVGAERVLQAQTVAQVARELGTDVVAHGSHRRRQRPGALRGGAAHARARARDPRAGARPARSSGRSSSSTCRSASCRCRRSARPTRSTAACGASRSAARKRWSPTTCIPDAAWVLTRDAFDAAAARPSATRSASRRACPARSTAGRSTRSTLIERVEAIGAPLRHRPRHPPGRHHHRHQGPRRLRGAGRRGPAHRAPRAREARADGAPAAHQGHARRALRRPRARRPAPRPGLPRHRGVASSRRSSASPARCTCCSARASCSSRAWPRRTR